MRFFSRPASGRASGSTLSASHEPPGRSGASHSSQARPSTISASRLATATPRVGPRRAAGQGAAHRSWLACIVSMKWPTARDAGWREPLAASLQALSRLAVARHARTLRQRFREDRLGLTASSLTFTTTIALVPLFTVMLAVFTAFPIFSTFQGALERCFLQTLVPDNIARPVLGA